MVISELGKLEYFLYYLYPMLQFTGNTYSFWGKALFNFYAIRKH